MSESHRHSGRASGRLLRRTPPMLSAVPARPCRSGGASAEGGARTVWFHSSAGRCTASAKNSAPRSVWIRWMENGLLRPNRTAQQGGVSGCRAFHLPRMMRLTRAQTASMATTTYCCRMQELHPRCHAAIDQGWVGALLYVVSSSGACCRGRGCCVTRPSRCRNRITGHPTRHDHQKWSPISG